MEALRLKPVLAEVETRMALYTHEDRMHIREYAELGLTPEPEQAQMDLNLVLTGLNMTLERLFVHSRSAPRHKRR